MANFKILLALAFILCIGKSVADKDMPPQPSIISTDTTKPNSTTAAPTTTPITNPPNTTTTSVPTSTSTTPPPKTTTNTTPAPTTSSTTTAVPTTSSTTTAAPTTTPTTPSPTPTNATTVAPITTPAPIPEPTTGNWLVNYTNSNQSCIVVDAAVQIEILKVNATSEKINLPAKALSAGKCDDAADVLNLKWDSNVLTFNFVKDVNASSFELKSLKLNLNLTNEPKTYTLVHDKPEFSTLLQHSYKCAKVQSLNLTEENKNDTIAYLHISHVQFQAFSNVTGHSFLEAIDCDASTITSDVVPIVVGCVLALLVVVVLVAYLVGRRRCQARGYLSM